MTTAADALMAVFGMRRACPHGKGPAAQCSQCLGIVPRKVHVQDHRLCIDGVPTDRDWTEPRQLTARRRQRK